MQKIILALAALAMPLAAFAAPLKPGETRSNIVYGSYSGLSLLMDAKRPAKPNGYAILHIPGSGFTAPLGMEPYGIKDWHTRDAEPEQAFLDAGFTLFTINHRAAPRFKYPAAMEDTARAARFVRAHAADYGVSADWLGVMGASSGGGLALMLGTRGDIYAKGETGRRPDCVVAVMAPTDMLKLGQDGIAISLIATFLDVTAPFPEESQFPGYAERLAPHVEASPITYVSKDMAKLLLIHGDADKLVPVEQSRMFYDKAKAAGADVELIVMPGVGHQYPAPYPTQGAAWMTQCLAETR